MITEYLAYEYTRKGARYILIYSNAIIGVFYWFG